MDVFMGCGLQVCVNRIAQQRDVGLASVGVVDNRRQGGVGGSVLKGQEQYNTAEGRQERKRKKKIVGR